MKKNEETLQAAMDRRLSFLDELPSCKPALMQRIAQEEAPVMKRKISVALVFALVIVSLSVIALATGLLLSPRVSAAQLAERKLAETYGVDLDMLTFFMRSEEELPDGSVRVTYAGTGVLDYVLGTYTVTVKDGKADVSWTHDGEEISGGYDSEAWGPEQLKKMIETGTDRKGTRAYQNQAQKIAEKHGRSYDEDETSSDPDETFEEYYARRENEKNSAMRTRKVSEEEMIGIAREFIISSRMLTESEIARMELYTNSYECEENTWYETVDGKHCFLVEYLLDEEGFDPEAALDDDYVRNNRYFKVFVNVETGVIEQYEFDNGLGGVG